MAGRPQTELMLVRHAASDSDGRLCGRTDVAARIEPSPLLDSVRATLAGVGPVVTSPALRCRQTALALWPDLSDPVTDARLWEQDFGNWEGLGYSEIPDLGDLSRPELVVHRPPGGESFDDLCDRVFRALRELISKENGNNVAVVAHAGTIRAALALALGDRGQGLGFEIAPLSITRLLCFSSGGFSIVCTNRIPE